MYLADAFPPKKNINGGFEHAILRYSATLSTTELNSMPDAVVSIPYDKIKWFCSKHIVAVMFHYVTKKCTWKSYY